MFFNLNRISQQVVKQIPYLSSMRPHPLLDVQKYFSTTPELNKQIAAQRRTLSILEERVKYPPKNPQAANEHENALLMIKKIKADIFKSQPPVQPQPKSFIFQSPYPIKTPPKINTVLDRISHVIALKEGKKGHLINVFDYLPFIKDLQSLKREFNPIVPGKENDAALKATLEQILKYHTFEITDPQDKGLLSFFRSASIFNTHLQDMILFVLDNVVSDRTRLEMVDSVQGQIRSAHPHLCRAGELISLLDKKYRC
jgi:hypothetical protein